MLGLFGDYAFKEKKETVSCLDMAKSMFYNDVKLIRELSNYLHNRKLQRNMPKKKAWEYQLKLLEKVPKEQKTVTKCFGGNPCAIRNKKYTTFHVLLSFMFVLGERSLYIMA